MVRAVLPRPATGAAQEARTPVSQLTTYIPLIVALLATGALSGLIAGLFGVGGGIITVPALGFVFQVLGYDPDALMHMAAGTSLATIVAVGTVSARAHHRRGAVDFSILTLWGPFIVASSLVGGLTAVEADGRFEHVAFPEIGVTNACFGGPDMRDLWATASNTGRLYKLRWPRPGLPTAYNA